MYLSLQSALKGTILNCQLRASDWSYSGESGAAAVCLFPFRRIDKTSNRKFCLYFYREKRPPTRSKLFKRSLPRVSVSALGVFGYAATVYALRS